MAREIPMINGDEYDALTRRGRKALRFPAGERARIKRAFRRRARRQGLRETAFLLGSPKNAARLRSALAQAKAGKLVERELKTDKEDDNGQ
jgi:hypothetical protein